MITNIIKSNSIKRITRLHTESARVNVPSPTKKQKEHECNYIGCENVILETEIYCEECNQEWAG